MGWGGGKGGGGGKGFGSGGKGSKGSNGSSDYGKQMRRQEQEWHKDAKSSRETDFFWETQANMGSSAGQIVPKWKLDAEQKEIFGQHDGNVGINFDKYDSIPVETSGEGADQVLPIGTFQELWAHFQLPEFLWYNIERCRYSRPTPIQRYAIPVAMSGRDAMCCAQTGSGKTCAFLMPILSAIDESQATGAMGIELGQPAAPKVVIMAPTRELCSQIHLEARKLSFGSKIRASEVYGGVPAMPQLKELAIGSDVVTATPGRLTDFINRGVMSMSCVGYLVLDEADRMLDMGFEPQIREVVEKHDMPRTSDGRMTLMFSATFPKEIQKLAQAFMRNYIWVGVGRVGGAVDSVTQSFVEANTHQKADQLVQLLRRNPNDSTLVFVAMKRTAASLETQLCQAGFQAATIHGDMEQPAREASLSKFRSGRAKILVATDVAARGLDIPVVSHVINYDLPENVEDYVHRIGRTGRIGRKGWATSFFCTQGNWANTKILGGLLEILNDAGQPVPDFMERFANQRGIRSSGGKGGGGKRFGGSDARGGQVHSAQVSAASKGSGGGRKGKSGGGSFGNGGGSWSKGGKDYSPSQDFGNSGGKGKDAWSGGKPSSSGALIKPISGGGTIKPISAVAPYAQKRPYEGFGGAKGGAKGGAAYGKGFPDPKRPRTFY